MYKTVCMPHAALRYNPRDFGQGMQRGFFVNPAQKPEIDFMPNVDITEDTDSMYIMVELPGVKKEDLKVSMDKESLLTIEGSKNQREQDTLLSLRTERNYGKFKRSFKMPGYIDTEKVEANFADGVLTLTLSKIKPQERVVSIN